MSYCQHCGEEYQFPGWLIGHVCETMKRDYIHPSALPDGPERDTWLEAETRYMPGDKPPPAMQGIAPVLPKLGVMAWIHRACAKMIQ